MSSKSDESVRALHRLCDDIRNAIGRGELPAENVVELKRAVDETRLRLWASMEAAKEADPAWVQEFWLQRAADICLSMAERLDRGEVDRRSPRAAALRDVAEQLSERLA